MLKIGSSPPGAKLLLHSGVVDTLSQLESIELYPYLVNKNEVCFKVFQNIIRLMITLCNSSVERDHEHVSNFAIVTQLILQSSCLPQLCKFVTKRSAVLYDLLRLSNSFEPTAEVKITLSLVTSLLSQLVLNCNQQLQRILVGSFDRFADATDDATAQVLVNISTACVTLCRNNRK